MSGIAVRADAGPFRRQLMLVVTLCGILAFLGTLVLGAYAPELRSGKDGGTHAMSNSAVGYSGLFQLAQATGREPRMVRSSAQMETEDLMLVSPPNGGVDLNKLLERRGGRATLIILPKWKTKPRPAPKGWVDIDGLMPEMFVTNMLAPANPIAIDRRRSDRAPLEGRSPFVTAAERFREPRVLQTMSGKDLRPMIVDSRGAIVLAKVGKEGNLFLLSDPDLLNNHGMDDRGQAEAALALLDDLNSTDAEGILFDVTANGFGGSRNPLQLAFDPPFLGVTLVIFGALFLAGWQALVRFGAPQLPQRAIAFGKAALVENSAMIVRKAGREARLGGRYAALARSRAAALFRLPSGLAPAELDSALDRLRPDQPFSERTRAVAAAMNRAELASAARKLNRWIQEAQQ